MMNKSDKGYVAALQEESEKDMLPYFSEEICGWELSPARFSISYGSQSPSFKQNHAEIEKKQHSKAISLREKAGYISKIRSRYQPRPENLTQSIYVNHNIKFKRITPIEIREIKANLPQIKPQLYSPNFMLAGKDSTLEGFLNRCKIHTKEEVFRMKSASPGYLIRRTNYYT